MRSVAGSQKPHVGNEPATVCPNLGERMGDVLEQVVVQILCQ